ncbi:MAG: MFS transporter [Alphaproteobacteria bacterium HGW-Alphaproteobacteria-16]|nr:MAG: MFS transporter [Alphaproteobacteria bacterium HGW-Alphaproteobacteria-16]
MGGTGRIGAGAVPPITRTTRVSYGMGAVANGVKNAAFTSYLLFFYSQIIGISASIVATAVALTLIVDAVADPLIGRWSDLTRSRWGRRHPFIYGAALPTGFFFLLAWFPPSGMSDFQTGLWIFATASLTRMCISAFEINTSAMTPEMTQDYKERTRLFGMRWWFGYAGTYGFTTICLLTFFAATAEYPRGQLNPAGYPGFAIAGALTIVVAILICGIGTHNRIPYLRQAEVRTGPTSLMMHLREMGAALNNRAFLAIFGFGVLKYSAIGLYSATTLFFLTYLYELTAAQLAILTIDSLVAATLAAPLAPIMSAWIGKRASSMLFAVLGVSIGLTPLLLAYFDLFFPPGHPAMVPTLFVIGALYGAMVAISLINTSSMLADVVEDSAMKTGRHEAGTFFAASSFMQQCSTAIGIFLAGRLLVWSDFPEKPALAQVTEEMIKSLVIHYIPTSIALWTLGALILLFYPITRAKHEANVAALQAREAEAQARELDNTALGGPPR